MASQIEHKETSDQKAGSLGKAQKLKKKHSKSILFNKKKDKN